MKKNILIVSPFFVPAYSYGWIVRVAYDQALWLIKHWYDVTVITTDVFDVKSRIATLHETIQWIKTIRFKNISNYLAKFQNLYLPRWMKSWLKENIKNYDIVHIHDVYTLPTYWACKYALQNNKKYFLQPHWTLSDVRIQAKKSWIKKRILSSMEKYFNAASGFFALTSYEIKDIQSITSNKNIYELPNGIEIDKFESLPTVDTRSEFWLSKNTKIITFLGRIQYIKWLDISLNILAELDKLFSDWKFLIIGPDEWEKSALVEQSKKLWIENKVIWYGLENTDKRYSLLKWSDVFLFTSRSEWFPMSLLEAVACNLPVYISEECNLPAVSDYTVWKVIDPQNTSTTNASELHNILFNKQGYLLWHTRFVQRFNINKIVSQLIDFYNKQ